MIARAALLAILAATPLSAQDRQPTPGWPPEGWTVAPLDDLPEMDLQNAPIQIVPGPQADGPSLEMYDEPVSDGVVIELDAPPATPEIVAETAPDGALLRGLDKVSGETVDLRLAPGETGRVGRLTVSLGECRYPADNPASDAFAFLTIFEEGGQAPLFSGWMLASSPALNPLDHARYDVWVLRCNNP